MKTLADFKIIGIVFRIPKDALEYYDNNNKKRKPPKFKFNGYRKDDEWSVKGLNALKNLEALMLSKVCTFDFETSHSNSLIYLSGILNAIDPNTVLDIKGKRQSTPFLVVRDSLKQRIGFANEIAMLCQGAEDFSQILNEHSTSLEQTKVRLLVGKMIQKMGSLWPLALRIAVAYDFNDEMVGRANFLAKLIFGWHLERFWEVKPFFDGKSIMHQLNIEEGPMLGEVLNRMWDWIILNPDGTKRQCEEYLEKQVKIEDVMNKRKRLSEKETENF